jgi:hypothetical protein
MDLPETYRGIERLKGRTVYRADGNRVGTVAHVYRPLRPGPTRANRRYVLVKRRTLRAPRAGRALYVPEAVLKTVEPNRVILEYPQVRIAAQGWSVPPPDLMWLHRR